jgi:hypothetical protein
MTPIRLIAIWWIRPTPAPPVTAAADSPRASPSPVAPASPPPAATDATTRIGRPRRGDCWRHLHRSGWPLLLRPVPPDAQGIPPTAPPRTRACPAATGPPWTSSSSSSSILPHAGAAVLLPFSTGCPARPLPPEPVVDDLLEETRRRLLRVLSRSVPRILIWQYVKNS